MLIVIIALYNYFMRNFGENVQILQIFKNLKWRGKKTLVNALFTNEDYQGYTLWSCQKVIEALTYLLYNFCIRFETKLYRQIVGIPMGTNCAPLVADLFLFSYERVFMKSLSDSNQADIIEAFNSPSRYLDDLLNIDNPYF